MEIVILVDRYKERNADKSTRILARMNITKETGGITLVPKVLYSPSSNCLKPWLLLLHFDWLVPNYKFQRFQPIFTEKVILLIVIEVYTNLWYIVLSLKIPFQFIGMLHYGPGKIFINFPWNCDGKNITHF